ncbi:hypothetical protein C900_01362 [Fulvivirga imtechensis AK7]|uniref:TonB-dependent receptor n=1 Tax=Fulvivirga imtechensis AK7 TaxID=1237149 RepID=L8K2T3_9BACT|nr:carboxypeptidase-like regulatory domain-containing protein [Fulvivirga imtechensis]ELR73752.1 hypothetical protein C900_01362 [Fulvivirga imtechensis AK7]
MRYILPMVISALSLVGYSHAQKPEQVIRGYVYDQVSKTPIEGVEVYLQNTDPAKGTSTDGNGEFILQQVPVGRYVISFRHIGYRTHHEDIIVEAGRPLELEITLPISYNELEEITITSKPFVTHADQVGKRSITIEQARRFAANYFDPARVMLSFPGVVPQNDQNNNIIVNGKSPNALLWRVEGMDVLSPNHLSNAGTLSDRPTQNGGGVNLLSTQMLGRTSFITAPFGTSYGNVLSGVMDMNFRPGNKQERHYVAQASLIGLDFAAEGPIKRDRSSFLMNYRYSTVGLLSKLGVDFGGEEINFQDLSFYLTFDQKGGGRLSFFTYGGDSNNDFGGVNDPKDWEYDKDSTQVDFSLRSAAFGVNEVLPLNSWSSLMIGAVVSISESARKSARMSRSGILTAAENYRSEMKMISGRIVYHGRITASTQLITGVMINYTNDELVAAEWHTGRGELLSGSGSGLLWQPYMEVSAWLGNRWNFEGGARYMHYSFNDTFALLPSVRVKYNVDAKNLLSLGYEHQAQKQSSEVYLSDNNKRLEMSKLRHVSLGYNRIFANAMLSSRLFYEKLYDVPVSVVSSSFSAINRLNEYVTEPLKSDGTGEVYGVNLSYEMPMSNGLYYIASASLFESTYAGSDGIKRDSRFNNNYSLSITAGKEFIKEKDQAVRITGVNTRVFYAGGLKYTPVSGQLSEAAGRTVYEESIAFSKALGDYFRVDFRLSLRKEKPAYTRIFAIDIQNMVSIENDGYEYYDFRKGKVVMKKQLGIIPILVYRVEF